MIGHKKLNFYLKRTFKVGKRPKPGLFVNFGHFPCYWIRIGNADPDPRQLNEGGSRWIRIHNIALK